MSFRAAAFAIALALLASCAPGETSAPEARAVNEPSSAANSGATVPNVSSDGTAPEEVLTPPLTALASRPLLARLENVGFDVGTTAFDVPSSATDRSNRALAENARYASLKKVLESDLAELASKDSKLGVGMKYGHRLFDPSWLSSSAFRFELAGVVNRVDRKVFAPGTCGEVRFLYRLAYRAEVQEQVIESRVPMTLNVVRWLPQGDQCLTELSRWQLALDDPELENKLLAEGGPLHELVQRTRLKSVEVNLQSVRWPSTIRPNMAGHAEYLMRAFRPANGQLQPAPLENTPDVARLRADPKLRQQLLVWLRTSDALRGADQGTVRLPDEFLATVATSVAPHGLARARNRPMSALFEPKDFDGMALAGSETFASAEGLLRRLDGLSCPGCHQTRSVAGFHFLGDDDASRRADVIAVPHSPHFEEDRGRRVHYFAEMLLGRTPDERRPPAERMGGGEYGAHCGLLPNSDYARWGCDAGLSCQRLGDDEVGVCLPEARGPGDVCEVGRMNPSFDARRDSMRLESVSTCPSGFCERNGVGFPSGMCSGGCDDLPPSATCGNIAILDAFNTCLARQTPFEQCILDASRPGALRKCSLAEPCREDYVCARLPSGEGGCIPPYFLFQMRVDGHVFR
jgi:hypothetical protein